MRTAKVNGRNSIASIKHLDLEVDPPPLQSPRLPLPAEVLPLSLDVQPSCWITDETNELRTAILTNTTESSSCQRPETTFLLARHPDSRLMMGFLWKTCYVAFHLIMKHCFSSHKDTTNSQASNRTS